MNIEEIESFIITFEKVHKEIINFIDTSENAESSIQNIFKLFESKNILNRSNDIKTLLHLINKITNNHKRSPYFYEKIELIMNYLKDHNMKNFENIDIFNIFRTNKLVLLILFKNKILKMDSSIASIISKGKYLEYKYPHFFLPELRPFIQQVVKSNYSYWRKMRKDRYWYLFLYGDNNDDKKSNTELEEDEECLSKIQDDGENNCTNELFENLPEDFEEKRKNGQNDTNFCKIIQNDSIIEFVVLFTKTNFDLSSTINTSIYETNSYLLKRNPSIIEYAAFYGSIQIIHYLQQHQVNLTPSLIYYAIHGQNEEMIYSIECDKEVKLDLLNILNESIKCHHNDITNYFIDKYSEKVEQNKLPHLCLKYYNFAFINKNHVVESYFNDFCKYDYIILVNFLFKSKGIKIKLPIISTIFLVYFVFFSMIYKISFLFS